MNNRMTHIPCLARLLTCLLIFCFDTGMAWGEDFAANTVAAEMHQSRNFENIENRQLLHACLAVIQDIKFQVTETEVNPGLIVAESPQLSHNRLGHSLTVSLRQLPGRENSYRVLLSAAVQNIGAAYSTPVQPDYINFYQDFFSQLQQQLFKQRSIL
jgi:hypothetical protein